MSQPSPGLFGAMLRRLREDRGHSRERLATLTRLGVRPPTIRDIESGKTRHPRMGSVIMLADALQLADEERAAFIAAAREAGNSAGYNGAAYNSAAYNSAAYNSGDGSVTDDSSATDGSGNGALTGILPPRMLPYDIETFTGRDAQLSQLADAARRAASTGKTVVCVVEGMGGLGKTALAVRAGHQATAAGLFPDAHLFLDLQGYTPGTQPLPAKEALRLLLHQMNVPHTLIPASQEAREARLRSTLAGKRTLIILDNARDVAQLQPLLPGSACCLVIVTSRGALRIDGATVLVLGTLPEEQAVTLFHAVAGQHHPAARDHAAEDHAGPEDHAAGDEPDPEDHASSEDHAAADKLVAAIVRMCACLPLAIQIVAARLSRHPQLGVAGIFAELQAAEDRRLSRLQDRDRGVRTAIESSLSYLEPAETELFTRLALIPGMDFDAYAAASLSGTRRDVAEDRLESLADQYLLQLRAPGRYGFHDLVRLYAQEVATRARGDDAAGHPANDQALVRLLSFYLHTAQAASRLFESGLPRTSNPVEVPAGPAAAPQLRTPGAAQAWLETELRNLRAAAKLAATAGHPRIAIGLSAALSDYLRAHGPFTWALSLHQTALDAATREGDKGAQAGVLRSIGGVLSRTGQIAASKEKFSAALALYEEVGDQCGIGRTLIELGISQRVDDENDESRASLTRALAIFRNQATGQATGNKASDSQAADTKANARLGEAAALTELSSVLWQTSHISEAERHATTALAIYRELGNRQGQAAALLYLGPIQQVLGTLDAAERSLSEARLIGELLEQRILVANSLLYLGDVQREAGRLQEARKSLERACDFYRRLSYRQGIAVSLSYLGRALFLMGKREEAHVSIAEAIVLFDELRDWGDKAEALNTRAALSRAAGLRDEARQDHEEALALATAAGSGREQGDAHLGLAALDADTMRGTGKASEATLRDAVIHCRVALELYEAAGYTAGIARAREMLTDLGVRSACD
jgi:tetratricopeptide (TPR) repeat protein/transcriptional regulator with XRE-family HTH domain